MVTFEEFFRTTNELLKVLSDPVVGGIVMTVLIALSVALFMVRKLTPLVIALTEKEKRKNGESEPYAPFDSKPKRETEWFVGADGELVEREIER